MRIGFFALGIIFSLSGCDRMYGVQSRTSLRDPVSIGCVKTALKTIPEAGKVTYEHEQHNYVELSPKQRNVRTTSHVWLYGEEQNSVLQINQNPDGWDYTNTHSSIGRAIPESEIRQFIPVMRKVNQAIQDECGLRVADLQLERISEGPLWGGGRQAAMTAPPA
ncbi:hypothetical protein [Novosphingobium sp. AP12]|uniref:hypothetical protein n=1 Tax=Novosphingobium sp. AP12 TaxID=1144305 RepID=UPI0012FC7061|nr:hypothetical protein [Novosphingobium sp. AP12]